MASVRYAAISRNQRIESLGQEGAYRVIGFPLTIDLWAGHVRLISPFHVEYAEGEDVLA